MLSQSTYSSMETDFGGWEMLPLIWKPLLLWSFDLWWSLTPQGFFFSFFFFFYGMGIILISAQSIQITGQLFPRKLEPKISSCCTRARERERERERASERERERESEWKRAAREKWLAESLVYPPSFYTLCCQCLTGSWLSRPNCFYPLYLSAHTRSYQRVCTCVCRYDVIWLSCFRGVNSLPPTRLFFFLIFLFIYFLTSPSFPGLCRAPW